MSDALVRRRPSSGQRERRDSRTLTGAPRRPSVEAPLQRRPSQQLTARRFSRDVPQLSQLGSKTSAQPDRSLLPRASLGEASVVSAGQRSARSAGEVLPKLILFEIEHCRHCARHAEGRVQHREETYAQACDAVCQSLAALMDELLLTGEFAVMVNKRPRREPRASPQDEPAEYPGVEDHSRSPSPAGRLPRKSVGMLERMKTHQGGPLERARTAAGTPDLGGPDEDARHEGGASGPSPKGWSAVCSRYPRLGAFELTMYDLVHGNSQLVFSKYRAHRLPVGEEDLFQGLFSFLAQFAVRHNRRLLLAKVATAASDLGVVIDFPTGKKAQDASLVDEVVGALSAVRNALQAGDPAVIEAALAKSAEWKLETQDVLLAQERLDTLRSADEALAEALGLGDLGQVEQCVQTCKRIGLVSALLERAEEQLYHLILHKADGEGSAVVRRNSKRGNAGRDLRRAAPSNEPGARDLANSFTDVTKVSPLTGWSVEQEIRKDAREVRVTRKSSKDAVSSKVLDLEQQLQAAKDAGLAKAAVQHASACVLNQLLAEEQVAARQARQAAASAEAAQAAATASASRHFAELQRERARADALSAELDRLRARPPPQHAPPHSLYGGGPAPGA